MSLLTISATLDEYVIDNYSEPLNVSLADVPFDDTNKDTWISCRFNPVDRDLIGTMCRIEDVGLYTIRCYGKYRKTSLMVVDEVTTMLDEKNIDNNIRIEVGKPNPPENLEDGIWETTVNFRVTRS